MKKIYRNDVIALFSALIVMFVVSTILPYGSIWIRVLVGFVPASLVLVAYMIWRKPDTVLQLEESLISTAKNAQEIGRIAKHSGAYEVSQKLNDISVSVAKVATKCMGRDLSLIEVQILQLESMTNNFIALTSCLTGEVALPYKEEEQLVLNFKTKGIPEMLNAVHNVDVSIDSVAAKRLKMAESELEMLAKTSEMQTKAGEAAQILLDILKNHPAEMKNG